MVRNTGSLSLLLIVALSTGAFADLIAYYPFSEGQGTATIDATGNGNNGTLSSGVEWVTGVKGGGVRFDTAGERIVIGPIDPSAGTKAMTLATWIKWEGQGNTIAQQGIIGKRLGWDTTGSTIKWFWQTNPAGDLIFRADYNGGGTSFGWGNTLLVPYANQWVHVAVTWNNGATVQYINGKQVSTGDVTFRESANATPVTIGCVDSTNTETFVGSMDEVRIYNTALTAGALVQAMTGDTTSASAPQPATAATDVPRDVVLSWAAGDSAASHDVYFGANFDAVSGASRTDGRGVLASPGQSATSYNPGVLLEFGQTYYWRVDEVNAPPSNTVHKGEVWSFTVEPFAYPIPSVTATASSAQPSMGAQNTVNGSGLDKNDLHGADGTTMWLSTGAQPNWIQYQFDKVYKLSDLKVWNSNGAVESIIGFGAKSVTIEYSVNGTTWTALADVPEFARAPGLAGYAANTTVGFGGVMARYVKLTIKSTWGGMSPVAGLSEVRFSYIPVQARAPQPAAAAKDVSINAGLDWRPGRDATSHKVYFGTDKTAVAGGTAPVQTVTNHGFDPGALNFGTTYYWKVDEIGTATYPGDVWEFTTQEYAAIDDFEAYNDNDNRIYDAWIDGYTDGKSGSIVGNMQAPFAEQKIIHGGKQAMPFEYNNVKAPYYSEASRTFAATQNWTTNGADTVALYFQGRGAGFVDKGNNAFTMSASGADIWNAADQFRFAYKSLNGNGSITARVDSIGATDVWAKGAIMIRETLDPGSKNAAIAVSASSGVSFQWRDTTNGASANSATAGLAAPYWIRITRTGNVFKAERSADGKTWTQQGVDTTVTMGTGVYLGLAVTSHNAALTTTAEFSNVSTTGAVTGSWQALAIGQVMPANGAAALYLTVEDKAGKTKTVVNPNPSAAATGAWTQWKIPLSDLTGVNVAAVKKLTIGVGDKASPKAGAAGMLYLDDISFGRPITPVGLAGK